MSVVSNDLVALSQWKVAIAKSLRKFERWSDASGMFDHAVAMRTQLIQERLNRHGVSVAFVAEFSRGKSELINALFFAGFGQRVVPSSAGRTTMCPTELGYDPSKPTGVRLLPINTRKIDIALAELKSDASSWVDVPFNPNDNTQVKNAIAAVQEQIEVSVEEAADLGLLSAQEQADLLAKSQNMVMIPKWRHALVNFPHPLLEAGLNIIDTPGLNAIGTEPELTLRMIPEADAVLFLLAADTGVTRSDIEVWQQHISNSQESGRFAVLNKIDGLWDNLKTDEEVNAEIQKQVSSVAKDLGLQEDQVFPLSAQKALNAKISNDQALLDKSRIAGLESALSHVLVARQKELMAQHLQREFKEASGSIDSALRTRQRHQVEQLFELKGLRGKNRDVMEHMAARIRAERDEFDKSLRRLHGLRAVFNRHAEVVQQAISVDALKNHTRHAREMMTTSNFSASLKQGMNSLTMAAQEDFSRAEETIREIMTLMTAMYRTFSVEHGLSLGAPMLFTLTRHQAELLRLQKLCDQQFGAITLATLEKRVITRRFLESVVARLREIYMAANKDAKSWLRAVMAPIEGQVREHQSQLKRRMDSIRRILDANQSLDERVQEIQSAKLDAEEKLKALAELAADFDAALKGEAADGVKGTEPSPAPIENSQADPVHSGHELADAH